MIAPILFLVGTFAAFIWLGWEVHKSNRFVKFSCIKGCCLPNYLAICPHGGVSTTELC